MHDEAFYFYQIIKEEETRIKVCFEEACVRASIVIQRQRSEVITWQTEVVLFYLEKEKDRRDFENLLLIWERDECQNYQAAFAEAVLFNRDNKNIDNNELQESTNLNKVKSKKAEKDLSRATRRKRYLAVAKPARLIDNAPLLSNEELLNKILKMKQGRF